MEYQKTDYHVHPDYSIDASPVLVSSNRWQVLSIQVSCDVLMDIPHLFHGPVYMGPLSLWTPFF